MKCYANSIRLVAWTLGLVVTCLLVVGICWFLIEVIEIVVALSAEPFPFQDVPLWNVISWVIRAQVGIALLTLLMRHLYLLTHSTALCLESFLRSRYDKKDPEIKA